MVGPEHEVTNLALIPGFYLDLVPYFWREYSKRNLHVIQYYHDITKNVW